MSNLYFSESNHHEFGWGYEVYNKEEQNICSIRRVRVGQWLHWSIVVERRHLGDGYIQISPGCQDEIREYCRKLGGKNNE